MLFWMNIAKSLWVIVLLFLVNIGDAGQYSVTFPDVSGVIGTIQTTDGGSVFAAKIHKNRDANAEFVAFVIKLDATGDVEWSHSINTAIGGATPILLLATPDQGFVLGGI